MLEILDLWRLIPKVWMLVLLILMTPPSAVAQCDAEGASNCQVFDPNGSIQLVMISDLAIPPSGVVVADDFIPSAPEITQVCVWGVYIDSANCGFSGDGPGCDCVADVSDDFRVTVFADAGGFPGLPLGTSPVSALTKGGVNSGFGNNFADTQMYEFQLVLDTPISGLDTSGSVYWLEVVNNTTESETCNWHWSFASSIFGYSDYSATGTSNGYDPGSGRTGDMAFCLDNDFDGPPPPQAACCLCPDAGGTCSVDTLAACDFNAQWDETQSDCTDVTCPAAPANENCAFAIPVSGDVDIATDTTCSTTVDPSEVGGIWIEGLTWYSYTVTCTGFVTVSMCATGNETNAYDSYLGVYRDAKDSSHCPCPIDPGYTRISSNLVGDEGCSGLADSGAGIFRSELVYPGECLSIQVAGFGDRGRGHLSVACAPTTCFLSSQPAMSDVTSNRFLSIQAGDPGVEEAIRVVPTSLSPGLSQWEGSHLWVGEPHEICENSGHGQDVRLRDCGPAPGLESNWFWAAPLHCGFQNAHFMDWYGACENGTCVGGLKDRQACSIDDDCVATVHLYHETIVADSAYDIQALGLFCSNTVESFSPPLSITQPRWGDIVSDCTGCPCGPPNGSVDIVTDVVSLIKKFSNLPCAPIKTRADLEPGILDFRVNITDVLQCLNAFSGAAYPFTSVLDPC